MKLVYSIAICAALLSTPGYSAPASILSSAASAAEPSATVRFASDNPNRLAFGASETDDAPQPVRDTLGASILGPQNVAIDQQNPDLLAPPTTDAGTVSVFFDDLVDAKKLTIA